MPVGTAIAVSSVAAAGIGAYSANKASKTQAEAARSAADVQSNAANRAADLQLGMFNTIRGDLSPYRDFGGGALPGLAALLGMPQQQARASNTQGMPTTMLSPGAYGGASGGQTIMVNGSPMQITYDPATGGFTAGGLAGGGQAAPPMKAGDPNWTQLLKDRPDVLAEYQRASQAERRDSPTFLQKGLDSPENYAKYWYNQMGGSQQIQVPTWSQEEIDKIYPQADANAQYGAAVQDVAPGTMPGSAAAGGAMGMQQFLESTPGYQFTRDQGTQAVENSLAARGLGGLSGSLGKGLARFVTGLADQTYNTRVKQYMDVAGMGQSAANQTGAFGSQTAQGVGNSLIGGANALAAGQIGAANAGAAGTVGMANALSSGIQGGANGYLTSRVLGMYGAPAATAPAFDPASLY